MDNLLKDPAPSSSAAGVSPLFARPPTLTSSRLSSIDALRAVAILLVLGRHVYYRPHVWYSIGFTGVDLFFVLSGFLVSGLLFHEYRKYGRIDVSRFIIRRGFKIYPAFYLMLLATVAVRHRLPLSVGV